MHENSGGLPTKQVCSLQRGNVAITWVMHWKSSLRNQSWERRDFLLGGRLLGELTLASEALFFLSLPPNSNPYLSKHFFLESFTLVLHKPWGRKRRNWLDVYSLLAHSNWKFSQVLLPGEGAEELTLVSDGFWAAARLLVAPGAGREKKWLFLCFALHELYSLKTDWIPSPSVWGTVRWSERGSALASVWEAAANAKVGYTIKSFSITSHLWRVVHLQPQQDRKESTF